MTQILGNLDTAPRGSVLPWRRAGFGRGGGESMTGPVKDTEYSGQGWDIQGTTKRHHQELIVNIQGQRLCDFSI